jgi:hypothetical protein
VTLPARRQGAARFAEKGNRPAPVEAHSSDTIDRRRAGTPLDRGAPGAPITEGYMMKLGWLPYVLSAATLAACSAQSGGDPSSEAIGTAEARIVAVPNGVACIRLVAAGSFTATHDFTVTAGQSSVLPMTKLPTGAVTFSGMAFNAACSPSRDPTTASWVATGVAAVVTPGTTGSVSIRFVPAGSENVNATFDDGTDGGVAVASTTWDPAWSPTATYANGNLAVSSKVATVFNVRTLVGHNTGKWYWEITATGGDGTTNAGGLGIVDGAFLESSSFVGSTASSLGFGYGSCCGTNYYSNWSGVTVSSSGPPVASSTKAGNVYMFALDMTAGKVWFGMNGAWFNGGDPGSAANPAATGLTGTVYPAATFYGSSINAYSANFGATSFAYAVPAGFAGGFY